MARPEEIQDILDTMSDCVVRRVYFEASDPTAERLLQYILQLEKRQICHKCFGLVSNDVQFKTWSKMCPECAERWFPTHQ